MAETREPAPNGYTCEACGAPATRMTADDVPLCEEDYQHILEEFGGASDV
jgi:hypothetical protein